MSDDELLGDIFPDLTISEYFLDVEKIPDKAKRASEIYSIIEINTKTHSKETIEYLDNDTNDNNIIHKIRNSLDFKEILITKIELFFYNKHHKIKIEKNNDRLLFLLKELFRATDLKYMYDKYGLKYKDYNFLEVYFLKHRNFKSYKTHFYKYVFL